MNQSNPEDRCCCNKCCNKNKFCFADKKESTLCSLYEVENFLCNVRRIWKGVEIYKILKF